MVAFLIDDPHRHCAGGCWQAYFTAHPGHALAYLGLLGVTALIVPHRSVWIYIPILALAQVPLLFDPSTLPHLFGLQAIALVVAVVMRVFMLWKRRVPYTRVARGAESEEPPVTRGLSADEWATATLSRRANVAGSRGRLGPLLIDPETTRGMVKSLLLGAGAWAFLYILLVPPVRRPWSALALLACLAFIATVAWISRA